MKKKILVSMIIITFISLHFASFATTISDYQSQQKETNAEKQEAEENLSSIQEEKDSVQAEVSALNESIAEIQSELSDLDDKIDQLDQSIEEQEKDLEEKESLLEERLVMSYMNGNPTYLDALLSGGIVNFVSNYETIKQIVEYDNNLIDEVKQVKDELEANKQDLQDSKDKVTENKNQLESEKKEREEKVKSLSAEEQEAQAQIEEKEAELSKINALVKAEQKKIEEEQKKAAQIKANTTTTNKNTTTTTNTTTTNTTTTNTTTTNTTTNTTTTTNTVSPTTSGSMSWPTRLTHKVNSIYAPGGRTDTSGYVGTRHMGVDIYAPSGTPIYAAQSGTVVYVNYSGYGGGWGLYVVIYHGTDSSGRAIYTRYAHASSIASGISVGTKVTTGTVIMYAGATGAAEGAHLHFEVCLNSMYNQVNPCPYLGISNAKGTY